MKRERRGCPNPLPDTVDAYDAFTIRELLTAYGETDNLQEKAMRFGRQVSDLMKKCHIPVYQLRINDSGATSVYYGDNLASIHAMYHMWKSTEER